VTPSAFAILIEMQAILRRSDSAAAKFCKMPNGVSLSTSNMVGIIDAATMARCASRAENSFSAGLDWDPATSYVNYVTANTATAVRAGLPSEPEFAERTQFGRALSSQARFCRTNPIYVRAI